MDERRAFLDRFDALRRGVVANHFLLEVRRGASDPRAVVDQVLAEMRRRWVSAERYGRVDAMASAAEVGEARLAHTEEALALAAWAIDWERLPVEQKEAIKRERAQEAIGRWMSTQPATERQLAYLGRLGWRCPVGDRRRASELIDRLLTQTTEVS